MPEEKEFKKPLLKYFTLTYLVFWVFLAFIGFIILVIKAPQPIQYILPIISSWTPTVMFFLLYKKLHQKLSIKEFLKQQFCSKIKIHLLVTVIVLQILVLFATVFSYSIMKNVSISTLFSSTISALVICFFDQIVRGPIGEELGWRGYALNELQRKHSPLFSAIILGFVWGFWHTPLWFLTSGYSGLPLIQYILFFLLGILSLSVIMAAFYNMNKNLLIPMIIHFLFNFLLQIPTFDSLDRLTYISIFYFALALILIVINPQQVLYDKEVSKNQKNDNIA